MSVEMRSVEGFLQTCSSLLPKEVHHNPNVLCVQSVSFLLEVIVLLFYYYCYRHRWEIFTVYSYTCFLVSPLKILL